MKSSKETILIVALLAFCLALSFPKVASAREINSSIAACLKAWGNHPFGSTPQFKTLETSVKVFGIGRETGDTEPTSSPSLVLINPSFNVMGGSTIELLNPNGWYCLRTIGKYNGEGEHPRALQGSFSLDVSWRNSAGQQR